MVVPMGYEAPGMPCVRVLASLFPPGFARGKCSRRSDRCENNPGGYPSRRKSEASRCPHDAAWCGRSFAPLRRVDVDIEERSERSTDIVLPVPADGVMLEARLCLAARPRAMVIISRAGSPYAVGHALNQPPMSRLADMGFALVTVDLLVPSERDDPRRRLDVFLLARCLEATAAALGRLLVTKHLRIGYVANGATAAGALVASLGDLRVAAIVSRFGRPDLAEGVLHRVTVPTLLVTGAAGLRVTSAARRLFRCPTALILAENGDAPMHSPDPGVGDWMSRHLPPTPAAEIRPSWHVAHPRADRRVSGDGSAGWLVTDSAA